MLDTRTAMLFTVFLDLILPAYAWISLAGQRTRATAWWCAGGPLVSMGLLLFALRSYIPDVLSFNLGNLLIVAGFLVLIQALRWQIGPPPQRVAWIFWTLGLFFIAYSLLRDPQHMQRLVSFSRGVVAVLTVVVAVLGWKFAWREPSHNVRMIAGVFLVLALVSVLQFIQTATGLSPAYLFIPGDQLAAIVIVVGQITVVVSNFSFVGLEMDRSVRAQVQIAAEQARADEDQRVLQQLAQLNQQGMLGVMSATLGHELNQPLTVILANAQVAEHTLQTGRGTPALLTGFFDKVLQNARRAAQIIEHVQGFKHPNPLDKKLSTLSQLVTDALQLMEQDLQQNTVSVSFNRKSAGIQVMVDPIQMSQVLVNVLRNAVVAMNDSALRQIHIDCVQRGQQALLSLRDTGCGLSEQQLQQAGEPFYTTKATGMGLGLSISRAILDQHNSSLTLRNADSGGAVAELCLPVFHPGGHA
jgi:signal transduction histidine kinase